MKTTGRPVVAACDRRHGRERDAECGDLAELVVGQEDAAEGEEAEREGVQRTASDM